MKFTVAAQLLTKESAAVSLEDIAQTLWSRIIQDGLLGEVTARGSSSTSECAGVGSARHTMSSARRRPREFLALCRRNEYT